jgi:hypothetical protein
MLFSIDEFFLFNLAAVVAQDNFSFSTLTTAFAPYLHMSRLVLEIKSYKRERFSPLQASSS